MGRKEIRDLILSLRDQGTTVFFSSHILSDAEMICDRVAIVNHGRLVAEGETQSLLSAKILEYEVVASGLSEQTVESARQRATKVIIRDKDTLFVFTEEGDVRELLVKVTQENATLMSLTPRRETLEEYFIREVSKPKAA
jgi:ABC-2 type transport system ATP-binding protein